MTRLLGQPRMPTVTLEMTDPSAVSEIITETIPASETANIVTVVEIAEEIDMGMKK